MDLAAALALAGRSMDVQSTRLRSIAETLANQDPPSQPGADARPPATGAASQGKARKAGVPRGESRGGDARWADAVNLDALGAARAMLSRTVEMLR